MSTAHNPSFVPFVSPPQPRTDSKVKLGTGRVPSGWPSYLCDARVRAMIAK